MYYTIQAPTYIQSSQKHVHNVALKLEEIFACGQEMKKSTQVVNK